MVRRHGEKENNSGQLEFCLHGKRKWRPGSNKNDACYPSYERQVILVDNSR